MAMYSFPGGKVLVHVAQLIRTISNNGAVLGVELVHPLDLLAGDAGNPVWDAAQGCVYRAWESGEWMYLDFVNSGRCQVQKQTDCCYDDNMV